MSFIVVTISFILAILSVGYGLMIMSVASGSRFYLFWFVLGVFFLLSGAVFYRRLYQLWPRWVSWLAGVSICIMIMLYAFFAVKICGSFASIYSAPPDYLIVLGAQMKEDGPSVVLKFRLDRAAEYLRENPKTVCIVSGAKGFNEPVTEARGMAAYLMAAGIDEKRIILEEKAWNTEENIRFSAAFLPSEDASVGIVTNNFHMYRALGIARRQGLKNVTGIAAGSTPTFLPHNVTREVFGVMKDLVCGNMEFW